MGFEDYICETEAASFSGVSLGTLKRFAEAGYLHIETDSDGLRLFSRSELISLFGLQEFDKARPLAENEGSETLGSNSGSTSNGSVPLQPTIPANESDELFQSTQRPRINLWPDETKGSLEEIPKKRPLPTSATQQASTTGETSRAFQLLEAEVFKLRQLNILHEKLLDLRESEIKDLKEQRDWLRTRMERLEEKGERDQILLLSETQTIRKLISLQEPRKSPVRAALEWLGFVDIVPTNSARHETIEIPRRESHATESSGRTKSSNGESETFDRSRQTAVND